jgi:beta-glucanase (GH16 family)
MKKHALLRLSALVLAVSALSAGAAPGDAPGGVDPGIVTPGPVAPRPGFYDNLSSYNTTIWRKADWTSPGNCQNTVQNITHNGGVMKLELNDTPAGGYDYSCAEYQTKAEYGYGIYSARIKAASRSGVVTGFFVYHGDHWGAPDHNEIDMEILGNAPTKVHLNYFTNGIGVNGEHEQDIDLSPVISGFDASSDYHTYTSSGGTIGFRGLSMGFLCVRPLSPSQRFQVRSA